MNASGGRRGEREGERVCGMCEYTFIWRLGGGVGGVGNGNDWYYLMINQIRTTASCSGFATSSFEDTCVSLDCKLATLVKSTTSMLNYEFIPKSCLGYRQSHRTFSVYYCIE